MMLIVDMDKPMKRTTMATTNPANGPVMAISIRSRRLRAGSFMLMKAPMVPKGGKGKGMK